MRKARVKRRTDATISTKGTSFSVRLSEDERDLLARAAHKRGWTSTTLLKTAAIERAAHILNTETLNKVDFRRTALRVAEQIFAARRGRVPGQGGLEDADIFETFDDEQHLAHFRNPVEVWPYQMPSSFLEELKKALLYGGAEFLRLLVEVSEGLTSRAQPNLPEPIDPSKIVKRGEKDAL